MHYSTYYHIMPDGTVKQINPFTGNEVWAVPGRSLKPYANSAPARLPDTPIDAEIDRSSVCSFCPGRYFEVAPEKSRWIHEEMAWIELSSLPASEYLSTVAEFRRVANLFEIVTLDYWKKNYGYAISADDRERLDRYASTEDGFAHLKDRVQYRMSFRGPVPSLTERDVLEQSESFFGGCHEIIIARRHYTDDATTVAELVSSGLLSPDEHYHYFRSTVESLRQILMRNRYVRYVSVFQNWLSGAGASFDHLHKQLVGLDEWGASIDRQVKMLKDDPNVFNEYAANFAAMYNLVFAENEHAIAFVGIGHRFPTIEVFSRSRHSRPHEHSPEELRGVSDLVHACHAAMGPEIACNEEWYYTPVDAIESMPWHILIKWRINVTAGFEGGTSIFINPMTPLELRDWMVPRMYALRDDGRLHGIRLAEECSIAPNPLKYYLG